MDFDFIWLHEDSKGPAYNGGRVIAPLVSALSEHCTHGDAPPSLDGRWTVAFDMSEKIFSQSTVEWQGALKQNSYSVHED